MALGPIPWIAMDAYADRMGIDGDDFDRMVTLLRAWDGAYLERVNKADKT